MISKDYVDVLKRRRKESKVYREYQLIGLEIAAILSDEMHKALYIRLAKQGDGNELLRKAKEVAERRNVKNKGAYFMRLIAKRSS